MKGPTKDSNQATEEEETVDGKSNNKYEGASGTDSNIYYETIYRKSESLSRPQETGRAAEHN